MGGVQGSAGASGVESEARDGVLGLGKAESHFFKKF